MVMVALQGSKNNFYAQANGIDSRVIPHYSGDAGTGPRRSIALFLNDL